MNQNPYGSNFPQMHMGLIINGEKCFWHALWLLSTPQIFRKNSLIASKSPNFDLMHLHQDLLMLNKNENYLGATGNQQDLLQNYINERK